MVVSIKKYGVEDLEVHGAITKFEVHVHEANAKQMLAQPSATVAGGIVWAVQSATTVVNVSLLKCDGEWLHIANIEKLLVEET